MTDTLSTKSATYSEVHQSWCDLLHRYIWQEFSTLTFKLPMRDPVRLVQMANLWMTKRHFAKAASEGTAVKYSKSKRDAYDRPLPESTGYKGKFANYWRRGKGRPVWVMAIEPHKSGALHAHMLINYTIPTGPLCRIEGTRIWKDELGFGFCRTLPVKNQGGVNGYVAKYVLKGNRPGSGWYNDIQFSKTFNAPAALVS